MQRIEDEVREAQSVETGGGLFTSRFPGAVLELRVATGPQPRDELRSHASWHRRQFDQEISFCGMWHSRPTPRPDSRVPTARDRSDYAAVLDRMDGDRFVAIATPIPVHGGSPAPGSDRTLD